MKFRVRDLFIDNLSYKLVSLVIALILWLTILGRRDFTLSKNIDVEVVLGASQTLISQSADSVKVKLSGPRTALRKFMDSNNAQFIAVDISKRGAGDFEIDVPAGKIDVPFGVKVQSIKPKSVRIKVTEKSGD